MRRIKKNKLMSMYRKKRQTAAADRKPLKKRIKEVAIKEIAIVDMPEEVVEVSEAIVVKKARIKKTEIAQAPLPFVPVPVPAEEKPIKEKNVKPVAIEDAPATGFKKVYVEDSNICRVTFNLPKEAAPNADSVAIAGQFNDWNTTSHMMQKSPNGNFTITVDLTKDREYLFKYIVDGTRWENDWKADRYEGENSVVVV